MKKGIKSKDVFIYVRNACKNVFNYNASNHKYVQMCNYQRKVSSGYLFFHLLDKVRMNIIFCPSSGLYSVFYNAKIKIRGGARIEISTSSALR